VEGAIKPVVERIIGAEELTRLLQALVEKGLLVAPVEEEGTVTYRRVGTAEEISRDFGLPVVPPKGHFLPQTEELYRYDRTSGRAVMTPPPPPAPAVLFGVRPCDVQGVLALDPVFGGRFGDAYWQRKRETTTIVALSCTQVRPECFCTAFGGGPVDGAGADLLLTAAGDGYYAEALSDKGRALVEEYADLFGENGLDQARKEKEALAARLSAELAPRVDPAGVYEKLGGMFEHPYWEALARKCLGCGICTFLCPTCHCFDIVDEPGAPGTGKRLRCWDSCMFTEFTLHTSGHNPRPGKKERVRNRFMHKLRYHRDRYGLEGCVGCGRCVEKCPVNLDIRQVIADIKEVR